MIPEHKISARNGNGKVATKLATRIPKHGHGKLLLGGKIGHRGAGGRPPDEFKKLCQQLASGDLTIKAVERILRNPLHHQFMAALKWATENGYGKPAQTVQLAGHDGAGLVFTFNFDTPGDDSDG